MGISCHQITILAMLLMVHLLPSHAEQHRWTQPLSAAALQGSSSGGGSLLGPGSGGLLDRVLGARTGVLGAGSGKLRLLTTLLGGLRSSGLEATIAGEILQRLIKAALRDILIPFTMDMFSNVA